MRSYIVCMVTKSNIFIGYSRAPFYERIFMRDGKGKETAWLIFYDNVTQEVISDNNRNFKLIAFWLCFISERLLLNYYYYMKIGGHFFPSTCDFQGQKSDVRVNFALCPRGFELAIINSLA